jgi:hypothetical protein
MRSNNFLPACFGFSTLAGDLLHLFGAVFADVLGVTLPTEFLIGPVTLAPPTVVPLVFLLGHFPALLVSDFTSVFPVCEKK